MTDLQKIELDMLRTVIHLCDHLNLKYYLVCGTALGAVKYQGFIPWDDDVDIALKREDYVVFCEKARELLPPHLFLQNEDTDLWYPQIYTKVRNSRTTYIETSVSNLDMNHGVYIDVFPLDGYPAKKKEQKKLERRKLSLRLKLACVFRVPETAKLRTRALFFIERIFGFHRKSKVNVKCLTKILSRYSTCNSDILCNHGNWQGKLEYAPREQYGNGTWATFEGLKVRIPENYDAYLTQKYGNWRAELPLEQQVGHHYAEVIDLNRPYTDYIEHLSNGKIRIRKPEEL